MSERLKTKIIAIMPSGPPYEYAWGPPPDRSWKNSGDRPVAFWAREWHDLLGAEVLKLTGDYAWESWQPDLRAEREYSEDLPTGVRHRLFPAKREMFRVGLRRQEAVFSEAMLRELEKLRGDRILLMLGATRGFHNPFYREILSVFGPARAFPIFLRSDGLFNHPLGEFPAFHKPLTYLSLLWEHFQVKKLLGYADLVSEQSDAGLAEVRRVYGGRVERLNMGCDFSFWTPAGPAGKAAARKKLGIPENRTVFFASGNFAPGKQLDKLALTFASLPADKEFFLIIAGQGPAGAVSELERVFAPLARQGRGLLLKYAQGEELRDLYWASDVYVTFSAGEGASVAVMKAMACGLPLLSTPAGDTADFQKELSAGMIVPVKDRGAWRAAILEILSGRLPAAVEVEEARKRYNWPEMAARYIKVFDDLVKDYFKDPR